jgi:hypothetical protein
MPFGILMILVGVIVVILLKLARKVEGEIKGHDHSKRQGKYEIGSVKLKK